MTCFFPIDHPYYVGCHVQPELGIVDLYTRKSVTRFSNSTAFPPIIPLKLPPITTAPPEIGLFSARVITSLFEKGYIPQFTNGVMTFTPPSDQFSKKELKDQILSSCEQLISQASPESGVALVDPKIGKKISEELMRFKSYFQDDQFALAHECLKEIFNGRAPLVARQVTELYADFLRFRNEPKAASMYSGLAMENKREVNSNIRYLVKGLRAAPDDPEILRKLILCAEGNLSLQLFILLNWSEGNSEQVEMFYRSLDKPLPEGTLNADGAICKALPHLAYLSQPGHKMVVRKVYDKLSGIFKMNKKVQSHFRNIRWYLKDLPDEKEIRAAFSARVSRALTENSAPEEVTKELQRIYLEQADYFITRELFEQAEEICDEINTTLSRKNACNNKQAQFDKRRVIIFSKLDKQKELRKVLESLLKHYDGNPNKLYKLGSLSWFMYQQFQDIESLQVLISYLEKTGQIKECTRICLNAACKAIREKDFSNAESLLRKLKEVDPEQSTIDQEQGEICEFLKIIIELFNTRDVEDNSKNKLAEELLSALIIETAFRGWAH